MAPQTSSSTPVNHFFRPGDGTSRKRTSRKRIGQRATLAVIFAAGVLFAIAPLSAGAGTVSKTFLATGDAYVSSQKPSSNYGRQTSLKVNGQPVVRTYLQFDLRSFSGPLSKATLRLWAKNSSTAGFDLRAVAGNWSEGSITYGNAPALAATSAGRSSSFPGGQWVTMDVTSLVTPGTVVSISLAPGNQYAAFAVASRESGSTTAPRLDVQTTDSSLTSTSSTSTPTTVPTTPPTTTTTAAPLPTSTTTAATTAPGTTTTAAPPASSDCQRPYTASSPWNTPLGPSPSLDGDSALYVSYLTTNTDQNMLTSDPTQYSFPLFLVDAGTAVRTVKFNVNNTYGYGSGTYSDVYGPGSDPATNMTVTQGKWSVTLPVPANAASANGSDGQAIILNQSTGDEWAFWQLKPDPASPGNFVATNGYHYNTNWSGAVPKGFGSRGPGMTYLAGLIRPCEILQGHVDHAIAFAFRSPSAHWVFPATKSDGDKFGDAFAEIPGVTKRLPEGARLQLDPSLTDDELAMLKDRHGNPCSTKDASGNWRLTPCLIIDHALQQYGMIVADHSGRAKIYAEYGDCSSTPCPGWTAFWGQTNHGVAIPAFDEYTANAVPLGRMRVVQLGPLDP